MLDGENREKLEEQAEAVAEGLKWEIAHMLDTGDLSSYDNIDPLLHTVDGNPVSQYAIDLVDDLSDPSGNRRLGRLLEEDLDRGTFCVTGEDGGITISFILREDGGATEGTPYFHYIDIRTPEKANALYGDVTEADFRALCLNAAYCEFERAKTLPEDYIGPDGASVDEVMAKVLKVVRLIEEADSVKDLVQIV